jgi:hypothetical protein
MRRAACNDPGQRCPLLAPDQIGATAPPQSMNVPPYQDGTILFFYDFFYDFF